MCTGYVSQRSEFLEGYEPKIEGKVLGLTGTWL